MLTANPGDVTPHTKAAQTVFEIFSSDDQGLSHEEVERRLAIFGPNILPRAKAPSLFVVFLHQFLSPLIYILLIAALLSSILQHWSDAVFIMVVLLINAIIGTIQEYSAERSAEALQKLVATQARVLRAGEEKTLDASQLVPGDVVLLESGGKTPADLRLFTAQSLEVDESLLTGESTAVIKNATTILDQETTLGDRVNMAFAGTIVTRGRGRGMVTATGLGTEIGRLSAMLQLEKKGSKPPLLLRMEKFTAAIGYIVIAAAAIIFGVEVFRGSPWQDVFLLAVAFAVCAIPEGLPVAITVALSIGTRRMAKRHVIVRKLVAVEALGSCTVIASDKTGTLTVNQLTVRRIAFPGQRPWEITGEGMNPEDGRIQVPNLSFPENEKMLPERLARAAVLCNEGHLKKRDGRWDFNGDTVDVALLVMAHKAGLSKQKVMEESPQIAQIPFESEKQFAATVHRNGEKTRVFVKGASEKLISMCKFAATASGDVPLNTGDLESQAVELARNGYRVLAFAEGEVVLEKEESLREEQLHGLTFLGMTGMIDPLRPEAKAAVEECKKSGIKVSMITGDHPETALAISRELGLADRMDQVVTGPQLKKALEAGPEVLDPLVRRAYVFARVEPEQKLHIVKSLIRSGEFVAVTGDGANDAPALSAAQVGVAMGERGTDVARESASLILTDDNFASIVAGVEEGRVAYGNVRKVIFLLISTGAAEIVLFLLALFARIPLPLFATQLLWLNLVTNGIQDVALAFEPAEGNEMKRPPRSPKERIFNPLMTGRTVLSAVVMGVIAFFFYQRLLAAGWATVDARNSLLLLMVLFENVQVFNSRSEFLSAFLHNPLRNPILFFGLIGAQLIHIGAMYTPWLKDVLGIHPVSLTHWLMLLGLASTVFIVMEIEKMIRNFMASRK
ncbi:MAG: HAD-IC family P-type ATPase [Candidatus Omnitrophota bacterium]|jgi:magnesium-transporting ATPase (P-type)